MSSRTASDPVRRRSKFLSLVLRHQPQRVGITLDDAGWVDVDVLLAACAAHGVVLTRAELDHVVATNDKQRFALSPDGARIRASQGHTVDVELGYTTATPPDRLYHGTVAGALAGIRTDGLRPMSRHAVHLSADPTTATKVGGRRGKPVVLVVRADAMVRDGHAFQVSANGVWLTAHVPPAYLELPAPAPAPGAPRLSNGRDRKAMARDTVAACEAGSYPGPSGTVELASLIEDAAARTQVLERGDVARVAVATDRAGAIEVCEEATVASVLRNASADLGVLNFASARNPGGGFLGGAEAQEESIARASALYPCLLTCNDSHYAPNRANPSALYSDVVIVSPEVPFFRTDRGDWLPAPVLATVLTCAAPNASGLRQQRSPELDRVPEVLRRRAELVLRVAAHVGIRTLILGAWGAGVFGNDPALVADVFAAPLAGEFRGAFDRAVFAIHDGKPGQPVLAAFRARFAGERTTEPTRSR